MSKIVNKHHRGVPGTPALDNLARDGGPLMNDQMFGDTGCRIDFTSIKTQEELDEILGKIFTNNPKKGWPQYVGTDTGTYSEIVPHFLNGSIEAWEYNFQFQAPNMGPQYEAKSLLFDYCYLASKAKSRKTLPLIYYNAILFLDSLGLSFHHADNTRKLMYVRKNNYYDILNEISLRMGFIKNVFDFSSFWADRLGFGLFEPLGEPLPCECGAVSAHRPSGSMLHDKRPTDYLIFPFTGDEKTGRMYHLQRVPEPGS